MVRSTESLEVTPSSLFSATPNNKHFFRSPPKPNSLTTRIVASFQLHTASCHTGTMADPNLFSDTAGLLDNRNGGKPTGIRSKAQSLRQPATHNSPSPGSISNPQSTTLTPRVRDKTPVWFKASPLIMSLTKPDKSGPWMSSAPRRLGIRKLGMKKSETDALQKPDDHAASNTFSPKVRRDPPFRLIPLTVSAA